MPNEMPKAREIKRLTTPLSFKNSKAYDNEGNRVNCVEKLSEIKYVIEPKSGILTDDEVLRYAPESKQASIIKLQRGVGGISDILAANNSMPWILGLYYFVIICVAIPFSYWGRKTYLFILLIFSILPLIYLYKLTRPNSYAKIETKKQEKIVSKSKPTNPMPIRQSTGIESLKKYEKEVNNLKVLYDVKEKIVKDLIEKRFAPPQLTYDKFMSIIDSCHKLFYSQNDAALNIINLAAEDTPRIQSELESKIDNMETIIDQIENLKIGRAHV